MCRVIVGILSLVVVACAVSAEAGQINFTNRATWLGAVGPLTGTEDFNSFAVDTQFRTQTVALNGMSVTGEPGFNGALTNQIDVSPFSFPGAYHDVGGDTPYLLGDLVNSQAITILLDSAITAWGADFAGIADSVALRPTRMDVFNSSNLLLGSILFSSNGGGIEQQFYGFQLTGGDAATRLVITNPGANNDVFGLDNIGFVAAAPAVPEPATLALMGLGGLGLLGSRYGRRKTLAG